MRLSRIKYLLKLLVVLDEVCVYSLKSGELSHYIQLLVGLTPLEIVQPLCWVVYHVDRTTWTRQKETPLILVYLIITKENLSSKQK